MEGRGDLIKSRYRKIELIGEGAYGKVIKCIDQKTDNLVAIKICKYVDDEGVSSNITREMSTLQLCDHPNVIQLIEFFVAEDANIVYLVYPFVKEDLYKYLKRIGAPNASTVKVYTGNIQNLMHQLISGVNHIHANQVLHRDLKPQNILVNEKGNAMVADMGLAREFEYKLKTMSREIGTLYYRPIEVLLGEKRYGIGVDVWSLGCIFYELATGEILFRSQSQIDTIFSIFQRLGTPNLADYPEIVNLPDFRPSFPKFPQRTIKCTRLDPEGNDLLNQMLRINPKKRISLSQALLHPYFKVVDAPSRMGIWRK